MSWVTSTIVLPAQPSLVEHVHALLRERRVADREHLVDQHDVGVGLDHHREREPHHHSRRVVLELQVDELLELGELDHRVQPPLGLAAREAHQHAVEDHVLARVSSGLKPTPSSMNGATRPPCGRSRVGPVDAGHDLEQAALTRAVAPDDPEELAPADVERDSLERLQLAVLDPRQRDDGPLLERVDPVVGIRNVLCTPRTSITTGPRGRRDSPASAGAGRSRLRRQSLGFSGAFTLVRVQRRPP